MTELDLAPTLILTHPDGTEARIAPADIEDSKALKGEFIELYSWWIEYGLATRDVVADPHCWELMQTIIERHEVCSDEPLRFDELRTDFGQLERLFFSTDRSGLFALPHSLTAYELCPEIESTQAVSFTIYADYDPKKLGNPEILTLNAYINYAAFCLECGKQIFLDRLKERVRASQQKNKRRVKRSKTTAAKT